MSDFDQVGQKQRIAVSPLTKGVFRDRPGQKIEDGGFWTIRNGIVQPIGVRRRPAFYTTANGGTFRDNAVDAISSVQTDGTTTEMLVTESSVYNISKLSGLTLIPLTYTTGTVSSADGDTITGDVGDPPTWQVATDDDWDEVMPGDYFVLDSDGTAVKISAVASATSLTLESTYPDTSFTEEAYTIYRSFRVEDTRFLVDTVTANDRTVFLSTFLPPIEIDSAGTALEYLQASGGDSVVNSAHFTAKCGAFFNERLWLGHIKEVVSGSYVEYRQRLRYSTATDFGNFDDASNAHYIDLDYTGGAIQALMPLDNLLAVYLEDAIYLGQGTVDTNNPLVFDQIETGGIGLIGQKAVVAYRGGHFFVGQDNIYMLSTRGLQPIGTPVLTETIRKCDHKWRVFAVADPRRNRICFGFPRSNKFVEYVWSFDYVDGSWSYEDYATWMIAAPKFDDSLTWDDLSGTWADMEDYGPTWDDVRREADAEISLVREFGGVLQIASNTLTADDVAGAIEFELESKDHDLTRADLEKGWTRLAIKLQFDDGVAFDSAVDFTCEVSHNRGRTWKDVGVLRIRAGMDEGHCDFRLISSTFRFRLKSSAAVVPYSVTEYTYSVTPFADESHLGSQEGD